MNLRTGLLSTVISLILILLGLIAVIVLTSLITAGLSALPLLFSGGEVPHFSELASRATESNQWMIVSDLLRGLGALGLIAFLRKRLDHQSFSFKDVGMTGKPNPVILMLTGIVVMTVIFFSAWGINSAILSWATDETNSR